jgi:hypothetical protein
MLSQPIPFEQLLYLLQHFLPYQLGSTLSTFLVSLMGTKGVWAWTVMIIDALEFFYIQVVLILPLSLSLSLSGYGTVDILRHCIVHFLSQFSFCSVG